MLTPTEYLYLSRPYWSEGQDMIRTTLQELCLKGALTIEDRLVYVDKRATKPRRRYFLKRNEAYTQNDAPALAENVLLAAFNTKPELSFAELRNFITHHFSDSSDLFKYKYVLPDLKTKGYFTLPNVLSSIGKMQKKALKKQLAHINDTIDMLIFNGILQTELEAIGLNIILLDKEVIDKIRAIKDDVLQIGLINFLSKNSSFSHIPAFASFSAFDSIHSFDVSDASFDFGGGDFDGGGGGDNW